MTANGPLSPAAELVAWRTRLRRELVAQRERVAAERRRALDERINALLEASFALLAQRAVAFCWPYRAEVDVRVAIRAWRDRGATAALPEVAGSGLPLRFRPWWPGATMGPGALGIPAPAGTEVVVPAAALVPLVGFDGGGYRLGYGGGYFDRTLASLVPRPLAVGVATEAARLPTIHPQPHDVAMDFIVTEAGVHAVVDGALVRLPAAAAAALAAGIMARRGI